MDKQQTLALLNHPDVETRLANLARLLAEEAAPPTPRPQLRQQPHPYLLFLQPLFPRRRRVVCPGGGLADRRHHGSRFHRWGHGVPPGRQAGGHRGDLRHGTAGLLPGHGPGNPQAEQPGSGRHRYMAVHSIPPERHGAFQQAIEPYRQARNRRNRQMVDNINRLYGHLASRWILTGMCCLSPIGRKEAP